MAGALPGIVGDVDVAFENVLRTDVVDEMADRFGHGVDMAGRAGDRLGQHAAFAVEHPGGQIARLAHAGRKGGAHQGAGLFLDHRDQPVPHDLHVDVSKGVHGIGFLV